MLKAILFDLDGTLLNTNQLISSSFRHAFRTMLPDLVVTDEMIIECIGPTLSQTASKYYPQCPSSFIECYRGHYKKYHDEMIEVFPGVIEMLDYLKSLNLKLVVVTSKKRDMTIKALQYMKMDTYFDYIVTSDDVVNPKPDAEPIQQVLTYYQLNPNECLMVGDNSHDIECAKNAKVKSVAVAWAMRGVDYLKKYNPDYIINETKDLLTIIQKEGI